MLKFLYSKDGFFNYSISILLNALNNYFKSIILLPYWFLFYSNWLILDSVKSNYYEYCIEVNKFFFTNYFQYFINSSFLQQSKAMYFECHKLDDLYWNMKNVYNHQMILFLIFYFHELHQNFNNINITISLYY